MMIRRMIYTIRVSDWAKKVDVMTSRLTILDVGNLCPDVTDVAVNEFP
jgi:hypothetical protein